MSSASLQNWFAIRTADLDQIWNAHATVGGTSRGRRYATQQINHAYVMLLSGQFQGFCRDLHSECVDHLLNAAAPLAPTLQIVIRAEFRRDRKLDRGNPSADNIGSDFGRLGVAFWDDVRALDKRNKRRQKHLERMNEWRNAIAHQDFNPAKLGGKTTVRLAEVKRWHAACDGLARAFDEVMRVYLSTVFGASPW